MINISDQKIEKLIDTPVSSKDFLKVFHTAGKTNIIDLADITPHNYNSVDQLFNGTSHIILFIAIETENVGHWLSIVKNTTGIYYMDSVGLKPLLILDQMKKRGMPTYNQTKYLLELIKPFKWNNMKYQPRIATSETCGRYTLLFIILNEKMGSKFNIENCYKVMNELKKQNKCKNYDELVVKLIN